MHTVSEEMGKGKKYALTRKIPWIAGSVLMGTVLLLSVLWIVLPGKSSDAFKTTSMEITVNPSDVHYTMKGGMGASWHAIQLDLPLNNERYEIPAREVASRGSAWGGNPPVEQRTAWVQLKEHASWLGMNFVRVELSQRMYEPLKGEFDWDNEEMQALYEILDWAQERDVDVFLQQMWSNVEWNAIPGIHPLISAPRDLDAFAEGIATLLEYLTAVQGYSCIKYFCMTNEPPGGTWGYWWEYGDREGTVAEAWKRLHEEFVNRGIRIPLSGPDWTDLPPFEEKKLESASYFGAIDIHSYQGVDENGEKTLRQWAAWAHGQDKPFFLTEYGNMTLGWGGDDPNQKTLDAAISNACDVIRATRAGVDAFNRWSYANRGDLDGQWQLVRTWDRRNKSYYPEVLPETEAYYGFGIISRFLSKYSSVVDCRVSAPDSVLMCTALVSPGGIMSIFLVNRSSEELSVHLEIEGDGDRDLYLYQVSREVIQEPGFRLESKASFKGDIPVDIQLPARSISALTGNLLDAHDPGVVLN